MEILVFAAAGGLIFNLLPFMEAIKRPKIERPDFRDMMFWLPFCIWPLLGMLLAYAYQSSGTQLNSILALNVGASAPLILRGMVDAGRVNDIDPGQGA